MEGDGGGEEGGRRKKRRQEGSSRGDLRDAPGMDGGEGAVAVGERDPLVVLGPDIFARVLALLDARSVARSVVVSRGWQAIAASDRLWRPMLEDLWRGKAHIPRSSMVRGATKLAAYSLSIMDSKRSRITKEDLCDHVWEFHFKEAAPSYWLNLDPFWNGTGQLMRRYFHPDGSQTADPGDQVWGGHECTYSIVTSYIEGRIRNHYVRINRWPQMSVSRRPDWGWELNNHIYCYSSVPDAEKEGGTGPLFPVW
ncbi:hypothetical protein Taro_017886 [Colocasia esculenta]|uniref:F-box domain-containing protein n=1 Tax=Colocasia esculenta TaxID=4460 RepID=A0A843UHB0_COLES|nr:hypothetical protein [Colocasia esculenta]